MANFSLLGNESVAEIFRKVPLMLMADSGYFIVQTIHPKTGGGEEEYKDGWRTGNWNGFNRSFTDPAPWYFRTLESWELLFTANGFILDQIVEPTNIKTGAAASIIFIGRRT